MLKFNDLQYQNFKDLIQFLWKDSEDEKSIYQIRERLSRFINFNTIQSLSFDNLLNLMRNNDEKSEDEFLRLQKVFPDIQVDPDGKFEPKKLNYSEIIAESLDLSYRMATLRIKDGEGKSPDLQVVYAKTLEPLIKMEGKYEYPIRKCLYLKKPKRVLSENDFQKIEALLKLLLPEGNNVAGKFLEYIYNKKENEVRLFIDHFVARLELASKGIEKEFLDNLKKIQ